MAADLDLEKENVVHRKGYEGFLTLLKWGTILSAIVTAFVVLIIAS